MARCLEGKMHASAAEKGIGADEEGIDSLAREACIHGIDLANGACTEELNLQAENRSGCLHVLHRGFGGRLAARVDKNGDAGRLGHHFVK
jgi:hypothetical protein